MNISGKCQYIGLWCRRTQAINNTKIQYLSLAGKIYKVTNIDLCNQTIEATRIDLSVADIPESEVFPVEEFGEFRIKLINCGDKKSDVKYWEYAIKHDKIEMYG